MTDSKRTSWVFYDGQCSLCRASVRLLMPALRPVGFEAAKLQEPWVVARLGLSGSELMSEMRVLRCDGVCIGGADACVYLARFMPWAWPLYVFAQIPGAMPLLRAGYRWVARHRACEANSCDVSRARRR